MDENTIIDQLEELIKSFGVQIRREPIKQDEDLVKVVGGLCLLRGEYVLIINSKAASRDKIGVLGMALKQFDHEKIYMLPVLRELLDRIPEQKRFNMDGKRINFNDPL